MNSYDRLFAQLPESLRVELQARYDDILKHYYQEQWGPSELNGGKFCEVVYTILDGYIKGSYPAKASKPRNMEHSCQQLSNNHSAPDSVRLSIPRVIVALYSFRNRRGVGHVGGEVDANHMDAEFVLASAKWILSELIRVFNGMTTKDARIAVEDLSQKELPLIWRNEDVTRIVISGLTKKDETILQLHSCMGMSMTEQELVDNIEHSNASVYRRDVIIPNHKRRVWEYNRKAKTVTLLPLGVRLAKEIIKQNTP